MPRPIRRKPKRIGIVGSRRRNEWEDFEACVAAFYEIYQEGDWIVSGGCPQGGDRFAELIAIMQTPAYGEFEIWELSRKERRKLIKKHKAKISIYDADWNSLGKGAGFIRNTDIARDSSVLIAVVAPDRTGGTEDTIRKMQAKQIENKVILV